MEKYERGGDRDIGVEEIRDVVTINPVPWVRHHQRPNDVHYAERLSPPRIE
jgi:hypothetical protein